MARSRAAWRRAPLIALVTLISALSGQAQPAPEAEPGDLASQIEWEHGPTTGKLGTIAEIAVPEGYSFTAAKGARTFLELTENVADGSELGVLIRAGEEGVEWFAIFSFEAIGYVKDDEKDSLDAATILKSIREGTEQANEERRKHGWATVEVVGWEQAPFYDPDSHNLSWGIRGRGNDGDVVNFNTRLLGRGGVMSANLVIGPEEMTEQLPVFKGALGGFAFTAGNRYAEFRAGDRIAKYGLTALVAGGAAAVAAKSGLLSKLWKLIVVAVLAVGAWLKKVFGTRRGGTDPITVVKEPPAPPPSL